MELSAYALGILVQMIEQAVSDAEKRGAPSVQLNDVFVSFYKTYCGIDGSRYSREDVPRTYYYTFEPFDNNRSAPAEPRAHWRSDGREYCVQNSFGGGSILDHCMSLPVACGRDTAQFVQSSRFYFERRDSEMLHFECPHCRQMITFVREKACAESGFLCPYCHKAMRVTAVDGTPQVSPMEKLPAEEVAAAPADAQKKPTKNRRRFFRRRNGA